MNRPTYLADEIRNIRHALATDTSDVSAERLRLQVVEDLDRALSTLGDREAVLAGGLVVLMGDLRRGEQTSALVRIRKLLVAVYQSDEGGDGEEVEP